MEMWELKQRGHSAPYLSPELKAFPAGSYDPQGFWSSFEVTPIVLAIPSWFRRMKRPEAIRICSSPSGKAR